VCDFGVYDNEKDAVKQKIDNVYPLAMGDVVVLQDGDEAMLTKRDTDVDWVPYPSSHDRLVTE
jgi:hypothetical protein